jgi:predicted nucleotidyltransferase
MDGDRLTGEATPFAAVNHLLDLLLRRVQLILHDNFSGMYLYGSLALGDFDLHMSDVDFVVAVADEVSAEQFAQLLRLHAEIFASNAPLADQLEGSYIPVAALWRWNPLDALHPHIDRGENELKWTRHDSDWVIRYWMVRERGIVLVGPSPKALIDQITARDLKQAVLDMLWWWEGQLAEPIEVKEDGYRWYTVQTMCRILSTMETGEIVSKPAASRWALAHLEPRWHPLIEHAMHWRPPAPMSSLDESLAFVRETLRLVDERARAEGLR